MTELVWYAAYGSNVAHDRFSTYLAGGRPPGAGRVMRGARDPSPPAAEGAIVFGHRLRFGGVSRVWGGGYAFIEPTPATGAETLGRRYLITVEQFTDVLAQESGRPFGDDVDLSNVLDGSTSEATVGDGRYDHVVALPPVDGFRVLTFTIRATAQPEPNPPSVAYTRTIVRGLVDSHGITEIEAHRYVQRRADPTAGKP